MNEYTLEFILYYINTDNFKQKNADILIRTISGSRVGKYMRFNSYGHIDFDENDRLHRYPHVTEIDKFNRSKVNCLIYDLTKNPINNEEFDKCFIYRSNNKKESSYGYVFLNTKTGHFSHVFNIEETYDALCIKFTQAFYNIFYKPLYEHYSKKYDACKGRNGMTYKDIPTIEDYADIVKTYKKLNYEL